jgi:putative ABC transport system permease protein
MFSGETPRDLTLADAAALLEIPDVERVAPLVVGSAPISARGREREVPVLGTTYAYIEVQGSAVTEGQFLPQREFDLDRAICVIGANVRRELFGDGPAIGESLRIGERRFRVVGVLADQGRSIGFDTQELVIVPVSAALALFNSGSLFRILVQTRSRESMARVRDEVLATVKVRHQGEEDVTVITQDALLATFDRIFTALTLTLAGIASISLAVAGILVMNVMLVAVSQRTGEVGLLKAIGATRRQVLSLFLTEAILLSLAGALAGIAVGQAASWLVRKLYPVLPLAAPWWAYLLAVLTALTSGIVFGMLPARRAARLDPVAALSGRK